MKNLKISARLTLAFAAVVLLLAGIVASSIWQFTAVRSSVDRLVDEDALKLRLAQEVLQMARGNGVHVLAAFVAEDEAVRAPHLAAVAQARQGIDEHLKRLDALVSEPGGRALLERFRSARTDWVQAFSAALALMKQGELERGRRQFAEQALPRLQALDEPAQQLADRKSVV